MSMRPNSTSLIPVSRDLARNQSGVSLIVTLAVLVGVMILGGAAVKFSASNTRSADRSITRAEAVAVAESGMNLARSTLWQSSNPTDPNAIPAQTVTLGNATVTYSGTYDSVSGIWTLSGQSSLASENPGAAPVSRIVSEQVQVTSGNIPDDNTVAAWSSIYVDDWQTCTQITDAAVIEVEMYVRGDLCMTDNGLVSHLAGKVQVWGSVDLDDTATIGTNTDKLPEVHVAGGCHLKNAMGNPPPHMNCTPADGVYAQTFSNSPDDLTMPPMDLPYWYANAKPGPLFPCNNGTSLPAGVAFDNNGVIDESNPTFGLTTVVPYDCQYWEGGEMVGQLAWSGGNVGTLTVKGTIFFDGDIHVRPNAGVRADYDGQATLYVSREIEVQEDVWLCGVAACDDTWDINTDLLVLVADGGGWHQGIDVEYAAKFQGGAFSLTEIDISHGGEFWGSAISRRVEFVDGTTIKQIPNGAFPILEGMPQTGTTGPTLANIPGTYRLVNG